MKSSWEAFKANRQVLIIIIAANFLLDIATLVVQNFAPADFILNALLDVESYGISSVIREEIFITYTVMILAYLLQAIIYIVLLILNSLVGVLLVAVPARYYAFGEVVTVDEVFNIVFSRPWRYIRAGILFEIAFIVGFFFCFLPGIAVLFTLPVYANKVFTTNMPIMKAFSSSFSAVYKGENGWSFMFVQILAVIILCAAFIAGLILCIIPGIAVIIIGPTIASFYVQNYAYNKGVVS